LPGTAPAPAPAAGAADAATTNAAAAAPSTTPTTGADILAAVRADAFKNRLGRVVLNRAVAMSLANDRIGLRQLARDYGQDMDRTGLAKTFGMLTSPGNGLAESVTAEMASIDQINSFVDEYRNILRQSSLSAPALTN
jgi:hypothetical protein